MGTADTLLLAVATFAGAFVQAATGFGFAILAAPMFLWVMNSTSAIAILLALHVVQSLLVAPGAFPKASRWHLSRFAVGALIGAPLGGWLFAALSVRDLKLAAGIAILAVLALIARRERLERRRRIPTGVRGHGTSITVLTGAASSFLTVLLVMPGPPLMAYFMSQRQAPQAVRALSLTFFAVCYVLLALYHALATGYDRPALLLIALLSPVVIVATLFGSLFAERFSDGALRVALFTLLFLSGAGAIVSAAIS